MKKSSLLLLLAGIFTTGTIAQQTDELDKYKIKTIVIDPGHGGKDPGCLGHSTSREKDIVLKVALKLGAYLKENLPDVNVVYTREKDVFVELHERAAIANNAKADLFLSIHCNSATPSAYGTEIYVMGLHKTEEHLAVAKKENAVILMEDDHTDHYEGFDPNSTEGIIWGIIFQNMYREQSMDFAEKVDHQFKERVHRKSRGVHEAGFLVLYKTTMPSVLIELGFITNKNEEAYLLSDEGASLMASAMFRAVKEYKAEREADIPEGVLVKRPPPAPAVKDEVLFKVQFLSLPNKVTKLDSRYKAITAFETEPNPNGGYRYVTGNFKVHKDAITFQNELKNKGIKDAYVVGYINGQRVNIKDAMAAAPKD